MWTALVKIGGTSTFWKIKRLGDITLAVLLLPALVGCGLVLAALNPFANPGPLFFRQIRIGRSGACFAMWKFRTMTPRSGPARFANSETHRIPAIGRFLRRYRIDELPQLISVLRGDMSLIGPRPEQPDFARRYGQLIPRYNVRHAVRPGVSGLSQVRIGYASDVRATRRKLALDLRYIRRSGYRMEAYVLWRTITTILTGRGAV